MSWTAPRTWTAGTIVGATALNSDVRDNLNFLLNGSNVFTKTQAGTWQSTNTTFENAYSATGTTTTQRVLVIAQFGAGAANAAAGALFRLNVNGTAFGPGGSGLIYQTANRQDFVTLVGVATGLATGNYTAIVQLAKTGAACTASIGVLANSLASLTLIEV